MSNNKMSNNNNSRGLRDEIDLFIQAAVPVVRDRAYHLGLEEAIQLNRHPRAGDRHTADCQSYKAMYNLYGCVDFVNRGGRPEPVCRFSL